MEGMEGSEGIKRTEGVDGTGGIDGTEGIGGINGMDRDGKMTFPMSNRIWVFTGGAHGAGGFSENRGFRNMAGLFEEVVRWDMCGQELSGRENFVFNTARAGYCVEDILREFQGRVACYRPFAVVYVPGEEDRGLSREALCGGLDLLRQRTEAIGARLIVVPDGDGTRDSLEEANRLLETVGAYRSKVEAGTANRLALEPAGETFPCSGRISLKAEPMKWLFVGDSITHGAWHTFGYDSVTQLWEKYIREDWGRRDDTVLNTGVSGATASEFLARLDTRYEPYADADVVVIMFGTNDCCFPGVIDRALFKAQLGGIVDMVRARGSQAVLRAPQPQREDAGERATAIVPFVQAVREVAREKNVPLVDHFQNFSALQRECPEAFLALMSDAVHPNIRGHYRMFREMAYALDMVLEDSMVSLDYPVSAES